MTDRPIVHWSRRIGLRVGVYMALVIVVFDTSFYVFDVLGLLPPIHVSYLDAVLYILPLSLLYGGLLAVVLYAILWRIATGRLAKLATEAHMSWTEAHGASLASEPPSGDEISVLARVLEQMRARVGATIEALERRDRGRREWVTQVSHDLRTPLAALLACLDRAQGVSNAAGPEAAAELRELLRCAHLDAQRLRALTEDLLEASRLEGVERPPKLECVPVGELVNSTIAALRPLATRRTLELASTIDPASGEIDCDPRLLSRALENLVSNALQHAASRVTLAARASVTEVLFEVADDGPGLLDSSGRSRPGQAPSQSAPVGSHPGVGGLGLLVVERVALVHGGEMGSRPNSASGCVFWISVPRVSQHRAPDG